MSSPTSGPTPDSIASPTARVLGRRTPALIARLALAAGSIAAVSSPIMAQPDANLPLTAITLYRSGVGNFQRQGFVEGSAQVQLRFDTDQINDILKSMVLLDLGGGRIDAVSYSSREPLQRRLASFAIDMSKNPTIAGLLEQIRGAKVKMTYSDGEATGTVIGVETRQIPAGDGAVVPRAFANLLTTTGIKSVDITTLRSFEILDADLAGELERALAAISDQRSENVKTVDLSFEGEGNREVFVAYIHEMPVWKTSYRLILPEETGQNGQPAPGGKPTLQGWAIVENTTDEDWKDVELSLVAGQPVGFQMDLYEPLFLTRPTVPVPVIANVGPTIYDGGFRGGGGQSPFQENDESEALTREEMAAMDGERSAGRPMMRAPGSPPMASPITGDAMANYAAQSQARAGSVGEVFQYTLETPVSIDRQRSAMIPIITSAMDGRRVSIFNRHSLPDHPMRGVEITNTSDLQLLPGPIAVFDGAAYAGDAQINHIVPGDKRLLSYAVDLDVDVKTEDAGDWQVQRIRIVDGLIEQTVKQVTTVSYTLQNKDREAARTVIVEHEKMFAYELTSPERATETTDTHYRFEVQIPAGSTKPLIVTQEQVSAQRLTLLSWDLNTFLSYQREGKVSQAVVDAFRVAAQKQQAINEQSQVIQRLENERNEITRDQTRINNNMERLEPTTDLFARYVATLNDQESRLEAIKGEIATARQRQQAAQADLENYLRNLNVQ